LNQPKEGLREQFSLQPSQIKSLKGCKEGRINQGKNGVSPFSLTLVALFEHGPI
jgi:hypothetical protein